MSCSIHKKTITPSVKCKRQRKLSMTSILMLTVSNYFEIMLSIFFSGLKRTKLTTLEGEALYGKSHQGWGARAPGATPDLPSMI